MSSWQQNTSANALDLMTETESNGIVKADLMSMLTVDSPQMREWRRSAVESVEWNMTRKEHIYDEVDMNPVYEMKGNIEDYVLSGDDIQTIVSTVMDKKQIDFERKQNTIDREMSDWEDENRWSVEDVIVKQFKKVINEHLTSGVVVVEVPDMVMKGCGDKVEKEDEDESTDPESEEDDEIPIQKSYDVQKPVSYKPNPVQKSYEPLQSPKLVKKTYTPLKFEKTW